MCNCVKLKHLAAVQPDLKYFLSSEDTFIWEREAVNYLWTDSIKKS